MNWILLAIVAALGAEARPSPVDSIGIARLQYDGGGDWYANPSSLPNLLAAIRERAGVQVAAREINVQALDPALSDHPYLYMTAQILAGLDGIEQDREPPPPTNTPYELADAEPLPRSLMEAAEALRQDDFYRAKLGDGFVDYLLHIKDAEIARFLSSVTDWEQAEYFEMF